MFQKKKCCRRWSKRMSEDMAIQKKKGDERMAKEILKTGKLKVEERASQRKKG